MIALMSAKRWSRSLLAPCFIITLFSVMPQVSAGTMTVQEMLENKASWESWANEGRKISVAGRYEGRTAQNFRLIMLPIAMTAPKNNPVPEKLQTGQTMEVSGILRMSSGRMTFDVSRMIIGDTDVERLRKEAARFPKNASDQLYALAESYLKIADFYNDDRLRAEVQAVRREGFRRLRIQFQNDVRALREHAETATSLGLGERLAAEVRFESILLLSRQLFPTDASKVEDAEQKDATKEELLRQIREHLKGWDIPDSQWDTVLSERFEKDAVLMYSEADETLRLRIHRRLFRDTMSHQILGRRESDGSNGFLLAAQLREVLPEEEQGAVNLEDEETAFRLKHISELSRAELEQLGDILKKRSRTDEWIPALKQWTTAQEIKFADSGLDGLLRTAGEYLYVADRWQISSFRDAGADVLKRAWAVAGEQAPAEANRIEQQLKLLGWERIRNEWLTSSQISALPSGNVQLAMREGRVVPEMTAEQVIATIGQPSRVSRIVSARLIRELWIYDARGGSGVVVQLRRSRTEASLSARVTTVSRSR
jgi:hypothetical protein